jgi:hypothetical protein
VVLVPLVDNLNGLTARQLQNELNAIYAQAATSWVVQTAAKLEVNGIDPDNLNDGNFQLLSNYTREMNTIIDAYNDVEKTDKNTLYLFLANKARSTSYKCGYMPLKNQFGFVFLNSICSNNIGRTIAHELGHGPFRLYHTFSSQNQYTQVEGTTDNLMDYADGTGLHKYQWDLIHDPEAMLFAFLQEEEEGEYVEEGPLSEVTRFINTIRCAKSNNLKPVNIHHAVNSYTIKVGRIFDQLNKYRSTSPSITSAEFKKAFLKVYIDDGLFSSSSDLYFGYHNFQLLVDEYERKPAQGTDSEKLIFSANGKPIIFSFPIGTGHSVQSEVLDWIERECGIKSGGRPFDPINFNPESDNIEDLFSLSACQLEQINKEDRKALIRMTLEDAENLLGFNKDTCQYLLASLIHSLKNQFVDFKHIEVGETVGSVNLLNMTDPYWNPSTWFKDYNLDWMLRAIHRGDDIYIASKIEPYYNRQWKLSSI